MPSAPHLEEDKNDRGGDEGKKKCVCMCVCVSVCDIIQRGGGGGGGDGGRKKKKKKQVSQPSHFCE